MKKVFLVGMMVAMSAVSAFAGNGDVGSVGDGDSCVINYEGDQGGGQIQLEVNKNKDSKSKRTAIQGGRKIITVEKLLTSSEFYFTTTKELHPLLITQFPAGLDDKFVYLTVDLDSKEKIQGTDFYKSTNSTVGFRKIDNKKRTTIFFNENCLKMLGLAK